MAEKQNQSTDPAGREADHLLALRRAERPLDLRHRHGAGVPHRRRRPASYWYKTERTGSAQQCSVRRGGAGRPAAGQPAAGGRAPLAGGRLPGGLQRHQGTAAVLGQRRRGPAAVLLPARGGRDDHLPGRTAHPRQVVPDRLQELRPVRRQPGPAAARARRPERRVRPGHRETSSPRWSTCRSTPA